MSPKTRLLAVMRGQPVDRVPLILEKFHYRRAEDVDDPLLRELVARVLPQTHVDIMVPSYLNRMLCVPPSAIETVAEEVRDGKIVTTQTIHTPKGDLTSITGREPGIATSWHIKYPVETLDDLAALQSVPWDLPPGVQPPAIDAIPPELADRAILRTGVSSPFVCVAGAMHFEMFLELCLTEPDLIQELTALCLERTLATLDVILANRRIEYVWMGGCEWLTPPMASPAMYRRFVQPQEQAIIERIHAAGAIAHVHCHGRIRDTLDMVIERQADYLEPVEPPPDGDVTMAEAKALAGGRITLGGNVEAHVLENGTPDDVEAAVRAAFAGGHERFVLANSAGPLQRITPKIQQNYARLIDLWEELSPPQIT